MMKIAICDDVQEQCEEIKTIWERSADCNFVYEVQIFLSAEKLLQSYAQGERYDLLVLDIKMHEVNGMDAAREIRCIDSDVRIIFLTAYDQYMRDAFDVSAMHYLDKPVNANKLTTLFRQVIKTYQEAHYAIHLPVINTNGMEETVRIFASEIIYFESYNRKVNVHLTSGEIYTTKMKISQLEQELRSRNFVRIHMSFLVNIKYMRRVNRLQTVLKYQEREYTLPVSRKQKDLVEQAFLDYRTGDYKL
ncbi:MAG: response regulator transcription factor [Peptococcaceae bacterium]|nr:response regulator transcription factor [Peptococcaceae bacterium]